jgi:hypothetical protein
MVDKGLPSYIDNNEVTAVRELIDATRLLVEERRAHDHTKAALARADQEITRLRRLINGELE